MMQCQQMPDAAERYVAGTMTDDERSVFEDHFFACTACFRAVQALQDAAAALVENPPASGAPHAQAGPQLPYKWLAMAATFILAVAVWNMTGTRYQPGNATSVRDAAPVVDSTPAAQPAAPAATPAPSPEPQAARPSSASRLDRWASISPPQYVPLTTRSAPDGAADAEPQGFNEAMAHYSRGRYRQAADGLGALADRAPDAAHIQFFLGISELMSNNVSRARAALERAAESGVSPYADEAHFYLAKAALRAGDLAAAARELQIAVEREAGPEGEAARLLSEVGRAVK